MDDKVTIGLTEKNRLIMDKIIESGVFKDQIHAAKFCFSIALNANTKIMTLEGTGTIWNIGSFDTSGEMRDLMSAFYPDVDTPIRAIEYLINVGVEIVGKTISKTGEFDLLDFIPQS